MTASIAATSIILAYWLLVLAASQLYDRIAEKRRNVAQRLLRNAEQICWRVKDGEK